ncbi:hypothetical protein CKU38_02839 [Xanthomonas citri pv. fuscans]|nr:hypothetical protein CKU38_02839 [Xanthomonas citri pv. fuscans]
MICEKPAKISANSLMQWMKSNRVSYFYTYVR